MLTNHAQNLTPLAFQAISRNAVYTDTFIEENPSEIQHIALGDWADAIIVTCNGKYNCKIECRYC